ncbi:O-antigen ligase family protein [Sulfidibacter corallicola]
MPGARKYSRMKQNPVDQIISWIFSIYLGTAPVFWFGNFAPGHVYLFKFMLVTVGVLIVVVHTSVRFKNFFLIGGLLGPLGMMLFMISAIPGVVQGTADSGMRWLLDSALPFVFVWTFYNLGRSRHDCIQIFWRGACIITILSFITIQSYFTGFPNWTAPMPHGGLAPSMVGFAYARTGWCNGVSLFYPIALACIFWRASQTPQGSPRFRFYFMATLMSMNILGTILLTGGRTGMLVGLFTVIVFASRIVNKWFGAMTLLVILSLGVTLSDKYEQHFKLHRLRSDTITMDNVSKFSSGRVDGYILGFELLLDRPLTGYGFGQVDLRRFGFEYQTIHNVWLKMACEAGIIYPVVFSMILYFISMRLRRIRLYFPNEHEQAFLQNLSLVVPSAIIVAMFSPNAIFGSFQNSAIFWGIVGYLIARVDRRGNELHQQSTRAQAPQSPRQMPLMAARSGLSETLPR